MKKVVLAAIASMLLLISGCATKEFVKQQTYPLSCKVEVLESKENALEGKYNALESRVNMLESRLNALDTQVTNLPKTLDLSAADKALLGTATDMARKSAENAEKADNSAKAAAASAIVADSAAKKAEKAFELVQKK